MKRFILQLFAGKGTVSQSNTYTEGGGHESSSYSKEGGSQTHTEGGSVSHSETNSESHSKGGSTSASLGHSYASGEVEDNTQAHRDQYNVDYQEGQKVQDAYQRLQDTIDKKPGFQSQYENKLNELYDQIMNRDKFSYDFNSDQMYQLYRDQYTNEGKRAMEDTLGKASSLTGGYASSYGQNAAQQTYQGYLQDLNNMISVLRDQAYQQYVQEGNDLLNKYGITNDAYNREYGQYRDEVNDWQSDRNFNYGMYSDERSFDYNQFANERNYWNQEYWNERNSAHTQDSQAASQNWNDTYAHSTTDTNTAYWEDSQTAYWENGSSESSSSSWQNTMANSMSMPIGGAGGTGGPKASPTQTYDYAPMTFDQRANTEEEMRARYQAANQSNYSYQYDNATQRADSKLADEDLYQLAIQRLQAADSNKVEDTLYDLVQEYDLNTADTALLMKIMMERRR